jgi:hypothetical protein
MVMAVGLPGSFLRIALAQSLTACWVAQQRSPPPPTPTPTHSHLVLTRHCSRTPHQSAVGGAWRRPDHLQGLDQLGLAACWVVQRGGGAPPPPPPTPHTIEQRALSNNIHIDHPVCGWLPDHATFIVLHQPLDMLVDVCLWT